MNNMKLISNYVCQCHLKLSPVKINHTFYYATKHKFTVLDFQRYSTVSIRNKPKNLSLQYLSNELLQPQLLPVYHICCLKSSKSKKRKQHDESSDDDSDDEDDNDDWILESGTNFREKIIKVPSLRIDAVLKAGLGLSRNEVEKLFYTNKIRFNEKKVTKKSEKVHEGGILDVLRGATATDAEAELSRVIVRKVGKYNESSDNFPLLLRKYPKLMIDNYKDYN